MVDTDLALQSALEHLSPEAEANVAEPNWATVRARLPAPQHKRGHSRRAVFAGAVALAAICVPAIAVSASVRGWLGLGPQPVLNRARLVVSAPVPGKRVARLWVSPGARGGECVIVTVTPAALVVIDPTTGAERPPTRSSLHGGSQTECTVGEPVAETGLTWMFSGIAVGDSHAALLHGNIGRSYEATRVDVVWNGGRAGLRFAGGYFIGVVPTIRNPEFRRLPYTVVAYNKQGHAVATQRIPTSLLYSDWKRVEGLLRQYRQSHGCSKTPARLWNCRSR